MADAKKQKAKRGRPKKPDRAYWDLHLAWRAYSRLVPHGKKKAAAKRFLRENAKLIKEQLGLQIGTSRSESEDAPYRQLLNDVLKGTKATWERRLLHLRQSDQWQEFERAAKKAKLGTPVILFIHRKSFGE